jgi:Sulfatase-modifying factor enzyme 1
VSGPLFDLPRWDALHPGERLRLARGAAGRLPAPFRLVGVRRHELGGQAHSVAAFDHAGSAFVLIPGGTATLGYDPSRPFAPTPQQLASWRGTAKQYGIRESLNEYIAAQSAPLRTVAIKPFLVEVEATEIGRERIPGGFGKYKVAYRLNWHSHEQAAEGLARDGFRLPTSDEWEYACRAGSRTLFRWGDDCPADCDPAGTGERLTFDLHRRPNAFGLHIAEAPYRWEFVAEWELMRGGDGGSASCGGSGFFDGWLPLASAFVSWDGRHYRGRGVPGAHVRRLYPLA